MRRCFGGCLRKRTTALGISSWAFSASFPLLIPVRVARLVCVLVRSTFPSVTSFPYVIGFPDVLVSVFVPSWPLSSICILVALFPPHSTHMLHCAKGESTSS